MVNIEVAMAEEIPRWKVVLAQYEAEFARQQAEARELEQDESGR